MTSNGPQQTHGRVCTKALSGDQIPQVPIPNIRLSLQSDETFSVAFKCDVNFPRVLLIWLDILHSLTRSGNTLGIEFLVGCSRTPGTKLPSVVFQHVVVWYLNFSCLWVLLILTIVAHYLLWCTVCLNTSVLSFPCFRGWLSYNILLTAGPHMAILLHNSSHTT